MIFRKPLILPILHFKEEEDFEHNESLRNLGIEVEEEVKYIPFYFYSISGVGECSEENQTTAIHSGGIIYTCELSVEEVVQLIDEHLNSLT